MRHIDRNCSIKLLYSYLTNPYHRWYGKTTYLNIDIGSFTNTLGINHGKQHEKRWKPWCTMKTDSDSPHPYGPWLIDVLTAVQHAPCWVICLHQWEPEPWAMFGASKIWTTKDWAPRKDSSLLSGKGRQISGPLSHFVCQSLSRKIWPSRLIWGGSGNFWRYLGNTSKEWEL